MNEKRQKRTTVTGYIGFFLLVAAIITAGVLIFDAVKSASGNDRPLIAGVMLAVVIVLAFLCTLIDYVRRRLTVERPVRTILEAVRRIAEGDFSVTLRPRHAYGN